MQPDRPLRFPPSVALQACYGVPTFQAQLGFLKYEGRSFVLRASWVFVGLEREGIGSGVGVGGV